MATRKRNYKKRGVMALFIVFLIVSVVLLFMFAFATPLTMAITVDLYGAGDNIMSNIDVNTIDDEGIRTSVNNSINTAMASTSDNITILSGFYQYSWLIIICIVALIMFLFSRKMIETSTASIGGIR